MAMKKSIRLACPHRVNGRCLIFSRTKRGTERIAKSLDRQGISRIWKARVRAVTAPMLAGVGIERLPLLDFDGCKKIHQGRIFGWREVPPE